MKLIHLLAICILVSGAVFCTTSLVHSQPPTPQRQQQQQPGFEYATLVTTAESVGDSIQFQVIWNAGVNDIIGQSNQSLDDATRRLAVQLGGPNVARSNLSTLLTAIGSDGWRLVESEADGLTRIFMRNATR